MFGRFVPSVIDDSSLSPVRVAILGFVSAREQSDFAATFSSVPCRREAAEAAADDQNVGLVRVVLFMAHLKIGPIGKSFRLNLKT